MTREEHLINNITEECLEVAQRASKALRFGMEEIQPGQLLTNRERLIDEFNDLVAVLEMAGLPLQVVNGHKIEMKIKKVERYLAYAKECGTLS